jgi:protein-L-isoaspartate(D-aspartate) O-methyltransferase
LRTSALSVRDAMKHVDRARFVPEALLAHAYADTALPIGHDQTISQPTMVKLLLEELELVGGERVLDVGTGSGYQAAILAELGADVYTIERIPALAEQARARLPRSVHLKVGDGTKGWPEHAPYDAIVVAAAAAEPPQALLDQLAPGGRLVIPIGAPRQQVLHVYRDGTVTTTVGCRFVPLVSE